MCGICGYLSRRMITKDQLAVMNDTMRERGPDDAGVELFELPGGRTLGMAQRRLSILDLSPLGHQPMSTPNGRLHVVFNGEIYNYRELKKELPEYSFRSNSDTEVILAAYLKWGVSCVEHFNGMFAIALYDCEKDELMLARDRMGQKPLYYRIDGDELIYASVLAPILKSPGFKGRIRRDILPRYLFQEYINAPDTILEKVYQVEPGTVKIWRRREDGAVAAEKAFGAAMGTEYELVSHRYWDIKEQYQDMQKDPVTDEDQALGELREVLRQSVRRRMIADVPLGAFLSGGYDSSLISAVAQEQLGGTPLKTFSIGFAEKEYDESPYARAVAAHLGTDHTEQIISEGDLLELVSDLPKFFDEPMADSSQIPTMLVSRLARQKVTVALSGDAGDELFCGYGIYDNVRLAQRLDALGALAHGIGQIPLGAGKRLEDQYPFKVRVISANRNPETKTQFGAGSYVELAKSLVLQDPAGQSGTDVLPFDAAEQVGSDGFLPVNYEWESRYPSENWQIRRMLLDMETYLPGDILTKVDRASMKYSLESRCPFLDPEVMRYSYRVDHALKYHPRSGAESGQKGSVRQAGPAECGGTNQEQNRNQKGWDKKYLLRRLAWEYIPKDLLERPKKGFSVPLGKWLAGPLKEQLLAYSEESFVKRQGIFDPETVSRLVQQFLKEGDGGAGTGRNYSKLLWGYYVFQQWADYWKESLAL